MQLLMTDEHLIAHVFVVTFVKHILVSLMFIGALIQTASFLTFIVLLRNMDIASVDLNAVTLPIPSEMRAHIFLASGRDPDMEAEFLRWGGESEFYTDPADAEKCGLCLFRRGFGVVSLIQPFFDRAGKESNVFVYDYQDRSFKRITQDWIEIYSTVAST